MADAVAERLDMSLEEAIAAKKEAKRAEAAKRAPATGVRAGGVGKAKAKAGARVAPAALAAATAAAGCRVFVGNLSFDTDWRALKDHMAAAGEIARADVATSAEGRSKGYGIVEYASAAGALQAITSLSNTQLDGRLINVREDREPEKPAAASAPRGTFAPPAVGNLARRLYVGNLAWSVSWQGLKDLFKQCGNVVYADVMKTREGRSKGCGIVEFQTHEEARRGLALHDTQLDGRPIIVVHNLPFEAGWQELKDHFRAAGDVVRAEVASGPDRRSKGFGSVTFRSQADANNAVATLHDSELAKLPGRKLAVRIGTPV
eukprot:PRCOL_00003174-RA